MWRGLESTFYISDVAQRTTSPVHYSSCFECKSHAMSWRQHSSPSFSSYIPSASSSLVFLESWMADKDGPFRDQHSQSLILAPWPDICICDDCCPLQYTGFSGKGSGQSRSLDINHKYIGDNLRTWPFGKVTIAFSTLWPMSSQAMNFCTRLQH